jgi:tetratricopeptide (TPR) repeat protein
LGRIAVLEQSLSEAIRHFERALDRQPEATSIHFPLGLAYRDAGDSERARHHLSLAGDGKLTFVDPLTDELSNLVIGARALSTQGHRLRESGQPALALRFYRKAVETDPDSALARHHLGSLLAEAGATGEAIPHLRRALELDPDFRAARENLALALYRKGELEAALSLLDQVLEADADSLSTLLVRAMTLAELGRPLRAVQDLESALDLQPNHLDATRKLASLLGKLQRFDEAKDRLRATLATDLSDEEQAQVHFELAHLSRMQGALSEAIEDYRLATQCTPGFTEAHFNMALTLFSARRFAESARAFIEVIALEPENERAHLGLAEVYAQMGENRKTLRVLQNGMREFPASHAFPLMLAKLRATSPSRSVRSGRHALELAKSGFEETGRPEYIECMALALAELGDFEQAIEWQQRLIELAEKAGAPPEALAPVKDRLEAFRRREAIRIGPDATR